MGEAFVGVDVGTGSARAGVFDAAGRLLGSARRVIGIWREDGGFVEQSSADIWGAVVASVREAVAASGVSPAAIAGLGFDATCSLVVLDPAGNPLPVGPSEDPARDVVVWMDHRALDQTRRINAGGHPILRYSGGLVSPEMQTPKLLWLKERRPDVFARAGHFLDLSDFLSWRATGSLQRSVCTLTCKWAYLAHEKRWDAGYFHAIGLGEIAEEGFRRIGTEVVDVAAPLGGGLSQKAAGEFGLRAGTPVGASLIDAHAGAIGTLGGAGLRGDGAGQMALILGTSSCAMVLTPEPVFVEGVWGPYYNALLPGQWVLEGGQSAYGAALDYLVALHPAFSAAKAMAAAASIPVLDLLEAKAVAMAGSADGAARLAKGLHIVPELLGNRSPEADPDARAVLAGLALDTSFESLVRLFVAGLCGLCYGTRQIVEATGRRQVPVDTIVVSGGAARSALLRRILCDATGLRVTLPETSEPVLLGSAMLGAVASGAHRDLASAARAMVRSGEETSPSGGAIAEFHARKYEVYRLLQRTERQTRAMMADA